MIPSLRTLVTIEIEAGNYGNMMLCYHRVQGDEMCPMTYYVPSEQWLKFRVEPRLRGEFSSKACPFHHYLELKQLEDTKRRRGQF